MKAQSKILVRGIFGLSACQKDDEGNVIPGTVRDLGYFDDTSTAENPGGSPNLITDNGMELLKGSGFLDYIMVGSGSTPPAKTDTTLDSFVAGISDASVTEGPHNFAPTDYPWCSANVSKQFGKGVAAGNLSEIGIGKSQTNMFARALIKDGSGNPTTITVLAIEYLTVTYQWRVYFDLTYSHTDTFTIDSVVYTTTTTVADFSSSGAYNWNVNGIESNVTASFIGLVFYDGAVGAAGTRPSGTASSVATGSWTDGPVGTYTKTLSGHAGTSIANMNVSAFMIYRTPPSGYPTMKAGVSPVLPKDNTKTLDASLLISWGRKVP